MIYQRGFHVKAVLGPSWIKGVFLSVCISARSVTLTMRDRYVELWHRCWYYTLDSRLIPFTSAADPAQCPACCVSEPIHQRPLPILEPVFGQIGKLFFCKTVIIFMGICHKIKQQCCFYDHCQLQCSLDLCLKWLAIHQFQQPHCGLASCSLQLSMSSVGLLQTFCVSQLYTAVQKYTVYF